MSPKGIYEPFLTKADLDKLEDPEIVLVRFNENTDNPHYAVFANGEPIAKLELKDQNIRPEYAELFVQDNYPENVISGIKNLGGLTSTLDNLNAHWYAAHATEGRVAAVAKREIAADMEKARSRQMVRIKGDLLNTINLALAASNKNYILQNALKDALVSKMQRAGIHERTATGLVEEAWREKGGEYFEEILTKAEEWLGAPKEALDHHRAEISQAPYRDPTTMIDDNDDIPEAQRFMASVQDDEGDEDYVEVPRSVPLQTGGRTAGRTAATHQDQVDYWRREMGLTNHLIDKG